MKMSVKRMLSVLMALVMLLGMTASAQVSRVTFNLAGMNGLQLDGVLSVGYDQDGCEQYMFENSQLGKWILQSDGNALVAGGDQVGYYAVSAEDLSTALANVISAIISNEMGEEFLNVMNYVNSPAYQADVQTAVQILAYEANRIASIAQSMGLVKLYENGDLEISCTQEQIFSLLAAYVNSLSDDTQVLNAFASLNIFSALGIPMQEQAAQLPAILKQVAANFENAYASVSEQTDGGFKLYISAESGVATGEYYTVNSANGEVVNAYSQKFSISEQFYSVEAVTKANGGVVTQKIAYSLVAPFTYTNSVSAVYGDQFAEASVAFDGSSLNIDAKANTEELTGEGKIVADSYGIKGSWNFTGSAELNGKIDYNAAENEFLFKLNYEQNTDSVKINCEYANNELYSEYTAVDNGKVVANWVVSGSSTYRVNGSWSDYAGSYTLNATLRMKKNGPELEGTYQAASRYGTSNKCDFLYSMDKIDDKTTLVVSMTQDKLKRYFELNTAEVGSVEKISVIYSIDNGRNVSRLEATAEMDTIKDTITAAWMLKENEYGDAVTGTFYWDANLIEAKWNDGQMNYRIYSETKKEYSDISVVAGLSGAQMSDPENVMDAILFVLNANVTNGLTFEMILNTVMGFCASAGFDGNTLKVEVTANNEVVALEGKMVETETGRYVDISGIVNGMPVAFKVGMQMEDGATLCFFIEGSVNGQIMKNELHFVQTQNGFEVKVFGDQIVIDGVKAVLQAGAAAENENTVLIYGEAIGEGGQKMGVYMPVTYISEGTDFSVSANMYVSDGSQQMDIGTATLVYEEANERPAHVAGTPLSANDLTGILLQLLESVF